VNSPQYVLPVLDLSASNSPPLPDPNPGGFFFVATVGGVKTSPQVLTINTSSAGGWTLCVMSHPAQRTTVRWRLWSKDAVRDYLWDEYYSGR
jgi:hypothetical protein